MSDKITLQRIELLHPSLRNEVKEIYNEICSALDGSATCRFSYTLRTFAEQDALYAQGRTVKGLKVTNAKGGQSAHNYGFAIDIVLIIKHKDGTNTASWQTDIDFDGDGVADWMEVVKIFKMYGWEWGGDWKFTDKPHFQKLPFTIAECLKRYNAGQVISGTNYIKLNG